MSESDDYSAPEYSDDDESVKKTKKKKPAKEIKDEKAADIKLPSQMKYNGSKLPPVPDPADKRAQFTGRPRHIKRNESSSNGWAETANENGNGKPRYEKPGGESATAAKKENKPGNNGEKIKNKPMVSVNFRPAREGEDFIKDDVKIYYQNSKSAIPVEPCVDPKGHETYESFIKSPSVPESRQFLDPKLVQNLKDKGITKIRPIQIAMMTAVFSYPNEHPNTASADILATSKTGSGKTFAYLVPLLQKAIERSKIQTNKNERLPLALIFVNTTELAMNVFEVLKSQLSRVGLNVVVMAASLNFIENTYFDIGICTNGRFMNHFKKTLTLGDKAVALDLSDLEYIVIDEVDKMATDSKFLGVLEQLKEEPKKPRIFGFSATIDADTTQIIRYSSVFQIKCGEHNVVNQNISQFYWEVNQHSICRLFRTSRGRAAVLEDEDHDGPLHPLDTLYNALTCEQLKGKRIMVFVKRTRIADYIAIRLRDCGVPAISVHRKLEDIQTPIDMYNKGEIDIAIGTQYFTRGIDTEVDVVINYDLPIVAADFIHRCGRTGRNGNTGIAITFIDFKDPENYNPEVVQQIVETLAEKEDDAAVPLFLKSRVDEHKEWNTPMKK